MGYKFKKLICIFISAFLVLTVLCSCAATTATPAVAPTITPTAAPTPTPTPMPTPAPQPTPQHSCALNHYALTFDAEEYLGQYTADYRGFVDAIIGYRSEYTFSSPEAKERSLSAIHEFPLWIFCKPFEYDFSSPTVKIIYNKDFAEFETDAQSFCSEIEEVLSKLKTSGSDMTDAEKVLSVYSLIASYQFTDGDTADTYSFLTDRNGMAFTKSVSFLLNQMDVPNLISSGIVDGSTHTWNTVKLGQNFYHLDTAFESCASGGSEINYFAMSDEKRIASGCPVPFSTGENGYSSLSPVVCENTNMDPIFRGVTSWKLDSNEHILYLAYNNDDKFINAVDTASFEVIYS